jgi:hypothetical protein
MGGVADGTGGAAQIAFAKVKAGLALGLTVILGRIQ